MKRDEWVRVMSESELTVGMLLKWPDIGGANTAMILAVETDIPCDDCQESTVGFELSDDPEWFRAEGQINCLTCDIREGRLYRLADWNFDERADDTTAPVRELVGTERSGR